MGKILSRTLPAVGHKLPLSIILSSWFAQRNDPDMDLYEDSYDIVYTCSGSAALVISLMACAKVSTRRKVIIPAYTCPSVLAAVQKAGLDAVLCDLKNGQLSMSIHHLEELIDKDTLAIVCVHLFGLDQRNADIKKLARNNGAMLIEDAAQALGNKADGRLLGSEGDLTVLSFGRGKPLSVLHGGAVVINESYLAEPVYDVLLSFATPLSAWFCFYYQMLLAAYSILFHPKLFALPMALPFFHIGETHYREKIAIHSMSNCAKKVLTQLLKKRKTIQASRAKAAEAYIEKFKGFSENFLYMPTELEVKTGPLRFPLVFKKKSLKLECLELLNEAGLGASGSYPTALNSQPGVPNHVAAQGPFPNAEKTASGILTIPTHEYVNIHDINSILKIVAGVVGNVNGANLIK